MDAARKLQQYTIDDIYALPDGERAELVDGKIYYMAPPGWKHRKILDEKGCHGSPDWIMEIVLSGNKREKSIKRQERKFVSGDMNYYSQSKYA